MSSHRHRARLIARRIADQLQQPRVTVEECGATRYEGWRDHRTRLVVFAWPDGSVSADYAAGVRSGGFHIAPDGTVQAHGYTPVGVAAALVAAIAARDGDDT